MRMRSLALPLAGIAILAGAARAQHFPADAELSALIRGRVEEGRATGIVLGVLEADGSTRVVAYGDPGPDRPPLDEHTLFEIGSITKAFTGVLLAEMTARGEVSLDDPVGELLPEQVRVPSRGGRQITLLDLATHHSGLPRLPGNLAPADPSNPYADYTVEQLYAFLSSHELRRDIGAEYEYSNLAVGLLGHALTLAAGAPDYGALVRARILHPLRMASTGVGLTPDMRARMAAGHDQGGNVVPLWDLPTLAGAGALRSDAVDMLRFLAANVGPPTTALERAMRASHQERKTLGAAGAVALNWHLRKGARSTIVWHNGGTAGFRTFAGFDPAKEVGVVVLTNSAHGADDIGFHLIDPEIPLAPAPVERVAVELDRDELAEYVGTYEMTPEFRLEITLQEGQLYAQATGQPRFPIFAEAEDAFFLRVVDAQLTFERGDDGAVSGLVLHQGGASQPARKIRSPTPAQQGPGGTLVVLNKRASTASIIHVASGETLATLPTGRGPHELVVSSDGRVAVGTDYSGGNSLTVIDVVGREVVRTVDLAAHPRPHGISFLPGDSLVAVTSEASNTVAVVRVADGRIVRSLDTGQRGSHMLGVVEDGSMIYTGNMGDHTVSALDLERGERVALFEVPPTPEAITVSRDGTEVWVGSNENGTVSVVDTRDGSVETPFTGFEWPYRILLVPGRDLVVLPDLRGEQVRFVERSTRRELSRLDFPGGGPQGVTTTPDGRWLFLSLSAQDRVALIDLDTREVVRYLATGAGPDGIGWSPR